METDARNGLVNQVRISMWYANSVVCVKEEKENKDSEDLDHYITTLFERHTSDVGTSYYNKHFIIL